MRITGAGRVSKKPCVGVVGWLREDHPDLAPMLWHSFGTIAALLQEIVCIYPALSPPMQLSSHASNRVCNALALLQCVASHADTKPLFLAGAWPLQGGGRGGQLVVVFEPCPGTSMPEACRCAA